MNDKLDPAWLLGPDGPVAQQLSNYEVRPQQIEMACKVAQAFEKPYHLVAEAGTGVGKSFAYLVPALRQAKQYRQKVIVSTYTISLQEQLTGKDIPFICKAADVELTVVLAKGRGNYICWRRLEQAQKHQSTLFEDYHHLDVLSELYRWALQSKDGSISDMPMRPPPAVWEMVCSDQSTCRGRQCNRYSSCFYQSARRRLYSADIVVANHALFFCDLALRLEGSSLLPPFKLVVLDEAHNIENVAGKHFGMRLSNTQVTFMLNRIFNLKTEKGILTPYRTREALSLVKTTADRNESFFAEVTRFSESEKSSGGNGRVKSVNAFANVLTSPLNKLGDKLRDIAQGLADDQEKIEIYAYAQRCWGFAGETERFINQRFADHVYWVESRRRRGRPMAALCTAPLDIAPVLKKALFDPCDSVILTSATLSISSRRTEEQGDFSGFHFFTSRLGIKEFNAVQLGSPFDFQDQVRIFVESYLPHPSKLDEFLPAAAEAVKKYLQQSQGRAFVLCTNYKHLDLLALQLQDFCAEHGFTLLIQGTGGSRSALLKEFRRDTNSVLLGTDSFWQGVDVPGASLSNVIIVKLPFSVPDHPLLQARLEEIKKTGGNPFIDYQLPEAILKFKQGFGRLIRTKTDQGIVVILDQRVVTKNYGRLFLNALPDCPVEINNE
ncbi:ATP-dependent DNA helicase [Planctomycetota bacterium]